MIESFKLPTITPETLTGSIVSFNDEYGGMPLKSCSSLISGYQEGSGTPSPDNVRPLHAFSSASLGKCDNNTASLWTIDNSFNGDVEFNQLLPSRTVEDTNTTTSWKNKGYALINVLNPTHKYFISLVLSKTGNGTVRLRYPIISILSEGTNSVIVRGDVAGISYQSQAVENDSVSYSITNENVIDLTQMFGSTIADYIYNLEIQTAGAGVAFFKALYPDDYYAYNAGTKQLVGDTLATFTFGQSIYQGSIDWKRGVVVGNVSIFNVDTTQKIEMLVAGLFRINKSNFPDGLFNSDNIVDLYCEKFNPQVSYGLDDCCYMTTNGLIIRPSIEYPSVQDFLNTVGAFEFSYPLAEPIIIPLGGINLLTQQGVNNIFCNTGDTEVKFLKVT